MRTNRPQLAWLLVAALFALSGCASAKRDIRARDYWPRGHEWKKATVKALKDPGTWAPAAGAALMTIDDWDEEKYGVPEALPLFDGFITCATCHFWRRGNNPKPKDYKLVRLVEITSTGIDWTPLCQDCHREDAY